MGQLGARGEGMPSLSSAVGQCVAFGSTVGFLDIVKCSFELFI